jgi:hypothetical protein
MRDFPVEFAEFKMPLEHEMETLDAIADVCTTRVEEIEDLLDKDDASQSYHPESQEAGEKEEETASEAPSAKSEQFPEKTIRYKPRRPELKTDHHAQAKMNYKNAVDHHHRANPALGTRLRPPVKRGRD